MSNWMLSILLIPGLGALALLIQALVESLRTDDQRHPRAQAIRIRTDEDQH